MRQELVSNTGGYACCIFGTWQVRADSRSPEGIAGSKILFNQETFVDIIVGCGSFPPTLQMVFVGVAVFCPRIELEAPLWSFS